MAGKPSPTKLGATRNRGAINRQKAGSGAAMRPYSAGTGGNIAGGKAAMNKASAGSGSPGTGILDRGSGGSIARSDPGPSNLNKPQRGSFASSGAGAIPNAGAGGSPVKDPTRGGKK